MVVGDFLHENISPFLKTPILALIHLLREKFANEQQIKKKGIRTGTNSKVTQCSVRRIFFKQAHNFYDIKLPAGVEANLPKQSNRQVAKVQPQTLAQILTLYLQRFSQ